MPMNCYIQEWLFQTCIYRACAHYLNYKYKEAARLIQRLEDGITITLCVCAKIQVVGCSNTQYTCTFLLQNYYKCIFSYLQCYQFRKRLLPADGDDEEKVEIASKLAKYNVSLPQYAASIKETSVAW